MKTVFKLSALFSCLLLLGFTKEPPIDISESTDCTGITLKSTNESFIQARTMEWGAFDMQPELLVFPRNYSFQVELQDEIIGMKWEGKYGFVGINALQDPRVADGLNEKGLAVSALYLPGYASYQPFEKDKNRSSISPAEVALLLLSSCESTQDVRDLLSKVKVVPKPEKEIGGITAPLHYLISDKNGNSIIVEYTDQQLNIYNNAVGVLTNSPSYPWHLTNLKNYISIGVDEIEPLKVGEIEISPTGAGSGMLGLPGDYTPPSRFVRATAMRNSAVPLENGERAISEAFRILNNFDIPIGTLGAKHDPSILGDTQYTVAADTKSLKYYYRTMNNHRIRVIDLKTLDFNGEKLLRRYLDINKVQDYQTITIKNE
ncbi:MAG: choloylglycine hydrolase family protein [Crocinitomicaceae bacterium]|nr:choloylglycine hydrolase family protein [Crocinitomicaceae bacterium]